ncbi:MAG: hypothetical protein JW860_15225, partial [Sedimentisphaerales bacterium]|nr:hypothetical protein [Sedimentisphaerales bacterium]
PNPIKVGFPVSVSCVIRNAGSADVPAGMYTIGLLWDGKNVFYGPGTVSVPAGGEAVFAIEPDTWQLTINKAGSYEYILVIDPDGKVPESDEKNNVTRGTITVEEVGKESGQ